MADDVAFLDLGATYRMLQPQLDEAVARALASGWYILGPEVEAFEAEFAAYVGAAHCISVANGLDALTLSLKALGVGPGDEVIVPSNTYIATWLAVSHVGATLVPVEPEPTGYNLDPQKVADALTERTRAIMPVHLYGQPAQIEALCALAAKAGAFVVEDAAQAHGARWAGRRIGAFGDATAWSFYPSKNLGAFGDAGAITTDDAALAQRLRALRNYGSSQKYHNEMLGTNSRMDPVQAAVLRVKLAHLDAWNARRAQQAARYLEQLRELPWLTLPTCAAQADHVWHVFVVQCEARAALQAHLAAHKIGSLIHYPVAPHLQPAYAHLGLGPGSFPRSELLHQRVLSLPIGPHLGLEEIDRVCAALRAFVPPVVEESL